MEFLSGGLSGALFVLVPAVIGIVVLIILVSGVRDLVRGGRLASQGLPAHGEVLHSMVRSYRADDSRRPHRIETIGFTTADGRSIRDSPVVADIGMTDRTGQTVTVQYDRDRPEQFIAPKDGRRLSPVKPVLKIAICVVLLVFLAGSSVFGLALMGAMS